MCTSNLTCKVPKYSFPGGVFKMAKKLNTLSPHPPQKTIVSTLEKGYMMMGSSSRPAAIKPENQQDPSGTKPQSTGWAEEVPTPRREEGGWEAEQGPPPRIQIHKCRMCLHLRHKSANPNFP